MTVTIELKPETENRLAEEARRDNLKVETFLELVIERSFDDKDETSTQRTAVEEWSAKFRRWMDSRIDKGEPFLSDEATRRENIYEDRF